MKTTRPFDDDARQLANRLFVTATAVLEDATEVAVAGQHPRLTAASCARHARTLQKVAADVQALADAALVVATPPPPPHNRARKSRS